jgi:hypothetical protein
VNVAPARRVLALTLFLGCRAADPQPVTVTPVVAPTATHTASSDGEEEDVVLRRRRDDDEPRLEVRRAWRPEAGDRPNAERKLRACCAEIERVADAAHGDERGGWMLTALTCRSMLAHPTEDPREALGKLRVLMEGDAVPAACK